MIPGFTKIGVDAEGRAIGIRTTPDGVPRLYSATYMSEHLPDFDQGEGWIYVGRVIHVAPGGELAKKLCEVVALAARARQLEVGADGAARVYGVAVRASREAQRSAHAARLHGNPLEDGVIVMQARADAALQASQEARENAHAAHAAALDAWHAVKVWIQQEREAASLTAETPWERA